jgi:hypothetical protein
VIDTYVIEEYYTFHNLFSFEADSSNRAVKGVDLWLLACWDYGFESRRGLGCLSLVSDVCCHVDASALV